MPLAFHDMALLCLDIALLSREDGVARFPGRLACLDTALLHPRPCNAREAVGQIYGALRSGDTVALTSR